MSYVEKQKDQFLVENFYSMESLIKAISSMHLKLEHDKSSEVLIRSGILQDLREIKNDLKAEFGSISGKDVFLREQEIFLDESAYAELRWDEKNTQEDYSYNSIIIQALSTGSIIIHGGISGTSILTNSEYLNKDLKKIAIQKAIASPRVVYNRESV